MTTTTLKSTQSKQSTRQPIIIPAPTKRPTRYDAWDRCTYTYCCGKWWKSDYCYYGNHDLKEEAR